MKTIIKVIFIYLGIVSTAFAQEITAQFFEKGPDNTVRFYYDIDYYLVDKNCEFKFIERVAEFDIATNNFNGFFKDFDPNGRTLLSGFYKNGSKEGEFIASYPDGTLKWKTTFVNNKANGSIAYYYPDGKPMLFLTADKDNIYINQYWNKFGEQTVKDGQGVLDITLPIMGFTEHGFTKYNTKGKIENGLREGLWYTSFVTDDKKERFISLMISAYERSLLVDRQIDPYFETVLIDLSRLSFSPLESFQTAELLQSKKCSFDEHTGFNSFIAEKFKDFLGKQNYKTETDETTRLSYKIRVTKKGTAYAPTIEETSREMTKSELSLFKAMINQVYYYLPSFLNGEVINDRLTISFEIQTNGDIITIPPVQITRENGL